jgi:hypothetical protein
MKDPIGSLDAVGRGALASLLEALRPSPSKPSSQAASASVGEEEALVPIGPLAPAFDLLHRARRAAQPEERSLVSTRSDAPHPKDPSHLRRLLEAALREEVSRPVDLEPSSIPERADGRDDLPAPDEMASPRELLRTRERRLRREQVLTARILDQMEGGSGVAALPRRAPLQQEVRILCPAGGASGGRFLLRNELGRAVRMALRVQPLRAFPGSLAATARVSLEPAEVDLAPGDERLVRVGVDLAGASHLAKEIELVVDALVGDDVVQKLWVAVSVIDPVDEGGGIRS